MANIKKVLVGGTEYEIEALHFIDGNLDTPAQWKAYIDAQAGAGFTFVVSTNAADTPKGVTWTPKAGGSAITGTLEANDALKGIYLVYHAHQDGKDSYDEYIPCGAEGEKFWEKVGNTDIDLSGYALKSEAGKAGTYTSANNSAISVSSEGGQTVTTTSAGEETAIGTATIEYDRVVSVSSETHGQVEANTGSNGAISYSPVFAGTGSTITVSGDVTGTSVDDHTFTPEGSISGTQAIASHSHTVNLGGKSTITYVSDVTHTDDSFTQGTDTFTPNVPTSLDLTKFNGGTFTQGSKATFTQGSKATLTYETDCMGFTDGLESVMYAPTVSASGVLSWNVCDASVPASRITGWTTNGNDSFTANGNDSFTAATLNSGFYSAGSAATFTQGTDVFTKGTLTVSTATFNNYTSATLSKDGAASVNFANAAFTGKEVVLSHTVNQGSFSGSTVYTPAGTINSLTVAAHSHTYNAPADHRHTLSFNTDTITAPVQVAVSAHTHDVTIASHTHTLGNHTHSVTIPNCLGQ